jgi:hypothetical protein
MTNPTTFIHWLRLGCDKHGLNQCIKFVGFVTAVIYFMVPVSPGGG